MKHTLKFRFPIKSNYRLFLLEVTFKVIFCVFLLPLLSYGLDLVMKLWGQSYITAENIMPFLTFPSTVLLIILFLIILAVYLLAKTTTMIQYCNNEIPAKKTSLLRVLSIGFRKTVRCIISGNIILPFYTILLYLLTNFPILVGIIIYARFGMLGGSSDAFFIKSLLILGLIFLAYIAFRGIFVIDFCVNEHQKFMSGLEQSKMLLKGRGIKTAGILIFYNLGLTIAFFLFYYVVLFFTALLVYLFADKSMVITLFLSVYPRINIYSFVFFGMIAFTTNINVISSMFTAYREEDFTEIRPYDSRFDDIPLSFTARKHKGLLAGFCIFVAAAGLFNFYLTVRNDSFYLKEALSGIRIASHRGNSHVAPENTLPALENAIVARSDYAEIDVQQTKDGVIILLHDQSLWRTTGLDRCIWELTYEETQQLDAG
jgi:glycerophosphoryl diester phosphodiesterase